MKHSDLPPGVSQFDEHINPTDELSIDYWLSLVKLRDEDITSLRAEVARTAKENGDLRAEITRLKEVLRKSREPYYDAPF